MVEKFKSFITEAKEENYRLLVVSNKPEKNEHFHTTQRLLDEAKKLNIPAYALMAESANIVDGQVWNSGDEKIKFDVTVMPLAGAVQMQASNSDKSFTYVAPRSSLDYLLSLDDPQH